MARTRKQAEDEVEKLYAAITSDWEPFNSDDPVEREADIIINKVNAARESGDAKRIVNAMMLKDTLKTVIIRMIYADDDPKMIPMKYLRHALMYPAQGEPFANRDQRKRVKNPTSAIRIKCMECQGQDNAGVRQCAAVNCFLWPFRMGGNPFFARMVGAEDELTQADTDREEAEEAAAIAAKEAEAERGNQEA